MLSKTSLLQHITITKSKQMNNLLKHLCLIILFIGGNNIYAQDTIKKKNGEILKVVVKEINDTQIKYYHFDDPNQVLFTLDRMMVTDINFSYGKKYKEEEPLMTDEYFVDDANMALKLSISGLWWNSAILSFDKAINPKSGYQISAKIFGIGFGPSANDYEDVSGFGLELGYRLKFGGLKKKKWEYRPNHLLAGGYIMPVIGFNIIADETDYRRNEFNVVHLGFNFGKQKVIQNQIIIDYYAGFSFFGGSQKSRSNGSWDEVYDSGQLSAGDIFGSKNIAISLGLKMGLAFGKYGEQKDRIKKRK